MILNCVDWNLSHIVHIVEEISNASSNYQHLESKVNTSQVQFQLKLKGLKQNFIVYKKKNSEPF